MAGVLLVLAIMFIVIHLPLMLFVRVMGDDDDEDEEDEQVVTFFARPSMFVSHKFEVFSYVELIFNFLSTSFITGYHCL